MKITNNYTATLVLQDGTVLASGQTVEITKLDQSNKVIKAWIDSKMITVETTKAAPKKTETKKD